MNPLPASPPEIRPSVARNATVLSMSNILSRMLGMVREIIIPHYFGATGMVSAFRVAEFVVKTLYDLLIGGMLSAALVPVLSDYFRPEHRHEFTRVASAILTIITMVAALSVIVVEALAPQLVSLLGADLSPELQDLATLLMRIAAPAIWMFASSGVLAAILFTRERFTLVALGDGLYNLGVIVAVPLLYDRLGIVTLAIGIVLGSVVQLILRLPDLRGMGLRLTRHWRHPALRRVWILYFPIFISLVVGIIQGGIDIRLANSTGENSLAYMRTATTLYQFPHGLVAVAISLASLPSLSRWAAERHWEAYTSTLGAGLRAVLVLIMPATIGLWVLAEPVVRLLAEHGEFTAVDTYWTALTLRYYLVGLVFASVDWPLNFSYYARNDSRTPAIVGIISAFVYLIVALSLLDALSFLGLALADGVKHAAHAVIMAALILRWRGALHERVIRTALLSLMAALVMGVAVYFLAETLMQTLGTTGIVPRILTVGIPAAVGGILYYLLLRALRVPDTQLFDRLIRRMFRR